VSLVRTPSACRYQRSREYPAGPLWIAPIRYPPTDHALADLKRPWQSPELDRIRVSGEFPTWRANRHATTAAGETALFAQTLPNAKDSNRTIASATADFLCRTRGRRPR
jgi:hypothetical protein